MNRRRWAIAIVSGLVIISIFILSTRTESWTTVASGGGAWEENVVYSGDGNERIVQLYMEGPIADSDGFFSTFAVSDLISQLDQAMEDETVLGVVIRVNSPGGSVVLSDEIHNKIMELKELDMKVVVSMGEVAASGGYYIAAPADYIFASPFTITGSLGVIYSIPNYEEAANKIGYSEESITSGNYKDIGNPLREMTESERDIFRDLVAEAYDRFVEVIATGRGMSEEDVRRIADGRIYSGNQAKKLGLIDEFGTLEDATEYARQLIESPNAEVIQYTEPFTFSSLLGQVRFGQTAGVSEAFIKAFPELFIESGLLYLYRP